MTEGYQRCETISQDSRLVYDFDKIVENPEYASYVDDLLEKTLVKKIESTEDMDIDPESYEEIRSVALEMEASLIDPEE